MRVALIACCAGKLDRRAPARELYTSPLFKKALAYALSITSADRTFIMSAQHGLVALDAVLSPYDRELSQMPKSARVWWGIRVVDDLAMRLRAKPECVVLLGGEDYNTPVRGALHRREWSYEEPLKGLNIGQRLSWLKNNTPTPPVVEPEPNVLDIVIPRTTTPIYQRREPYVTQHQTSLGWRVELYDPTISETDPQRTVRPLSKFTAAQKRQMITNYKYVKETRDAQNDQ